MTTRIKDRKYEGLLAEKGFRGFPSLAFLDAEGNIVAQPQGRSVAAFLRTHAAIGELAALKKRMDGGEADLDAALLLCENDLGQVTSDSFKTRAAALSKVSDEQKSTIDRIIVDNEIIGVARGARRGGLEDAAKKLLALKEAGKGPSKSHTAISSFWGTLGRWAMESRDPQLARQAADGMQAGFADDEGAAGWVKGFDERATKLAAWSDLSKKVEGGDAACKTDLTLIEYDLGFVQGSAFVEQAKALLEGASPEQKIKLEEGMLKATFLDLASSARGDGMEEAAKAMLALLDEGKQPPGSSAIRVWATLARYAVQTKDADLLERAATGIADIGEKRFASYATSLVKQAKELRAAQEKDPQEKDPQEKDPQEKEEPRR